MAGAQGRRGESAAGNTGKSWMDPFSDLGIALTNWTVRYVPDAWIIAVILNIIVFAMVLVWGRTGVLGAFNAWGKGFWSLLTLMAQFSFIIIVSYACAASPIVSRGLNYLASRPNPDKPWQACLFVALLSLASAYINWAFTLVLSAMFVPFVARQNPKTDFRLLVASAYVGLGTLWHSGLSGSATLIVATPDNFLMKSGVLKELIPVSRTMFAPFNFLLIAITVIVVSIAVILLTPKPHKAYLLKKEEIDALVAIEVLPERPARPSFAQWLHYSPITNVVSGLACLVVIVNSFRTGGLGAWTIDMYNWVFLTLALFLTWRPAVFLDGCKKGITGAWGIMVQYPFYGGIFGLVSFTYLGHFLTDVLTSLCTRNTFLPIIYWYSGVLSYFVPSGGSKWAIEAPYILPAAKSMGVSVASATLIYGWGDMLTHLLQPFWAIPILSITNTKFGDIAGFCAVIFVIYAFFLTIAMCFAPIGL